MYKNSNCIVKLYKYCIFIMLFSFPFAVLTANGKVNVYPLVKKYIGPVSNLDREKYFNIHEKTSDTDLKNFCTLYNVNRARDFWGPGIYAVQQKGQVGVYPPYKTGNTTVRPVTRWVSTEHPNNMYKAGINPDDVANWVVEYFKNYADVESRAMYFEPMNEPFVHARDFYSEPDWDVAAEARVKLEMSHVFNKIGEKIHQAPELSLMKVIGNSEAYPQFEGKDFAGWNKNMKVFMDVAGSNMDAISYHLYDGANVIGLSTKRSGSNVDAIMDLVETYSFIKWGFVKPHAITEYGATLSTSSTVYGVNIMQRVRSINHMIFQLLDRQDKMEISIPFIVGKATWNITAANNYQPYSAALFEPIPLGVPLSQVTGWKYNDAISFYKLWQNVKGERVDIRSDNPDIQVQAFYDNSKLYVVLNNLDDVTQTVDLSINGTLPSIKEIQKKSLKIYTDKRAVFEETLTTIVPTSVVLEYGETCVYEFSFNQPVDYNQKLTKNRYYSLQHLKPIQKSVDNNFEFNNIPNIAQGYASISLSFGRLIALSKRPTVYVNGTFVSVPFNWKGYNQSNREDFFGAIEIPLPISLLKNNNVVSVKFSDAGGYVSSVVLNVEELAEYVNTGTRTPVSKKKLYPNPTERMIYFDGFQPNVPMDLYSIDGKLTGKFFNDGKGIDLAHVDKGVYVLKINYQNYKVIKQ